MSSERAVPVLCIINEVKTILVIRDPATKVRPLLAVRTGSTGSVILVNDVKTKTKNTYIRYRQGEIARRKRVRQAEIKQNISRDKRQLREHRLKKKK